MRLLSAIIIAFIALTSLPAQCEDYNKLKQLLQTLRTVKYKKANPEPATVNQKQKEAAAKTDAKTKSAVAGKITGANGKPSLFNSNGKATTPVPPKKSAAVVKPKEVKQAPSAKAKPKPAPKAPKAVAVKKTAPKNKVVMPATPENIQIKYENGFVVIKAPIQQIQPPKEVTPEVKKPVVQQRKANLGIPVKKPKAQLPNKPSKSKHFQAFKISKPTEAAPIPNIHVDPPPPNPNHRQWLRQAARAERKKALLKEFMQRVRQKRLKATQSPNIKPEDIDNYYSGKNELQNQNKDGSVYIRPKNSEQLPGLSMPFIKISPEDAKKLRALLKLPNPKK